MSVVGPFGVVSGGKRTFTSLSNSTHTRGPVAGLYVPESGRMNRHQIQFNTDWVQLNTQRIHQALNFFDRDKFVQDAVTMKLNHILGGGISFRRRFHKLTPASMRWLSTTYINILRQIYRYGLACGFAAQSVKPNEQHVGEPILLDLTRVDSYMLKDIWGQTHLKFFEVQSNVGASHDYEIENINIIAFNMPDAGGMIKSIADVLLPDYYTEMMLQSYMVLACKMKCFPPLVTEKVTTNTDNRELYSSFGISSQMNGGVNTQMRDAGASFARQEAERTTKMMLREYNQGPTAGSSREVDAPQSSGTHATLYGNQVFLDNDRTVARVEPAQEPNRYIEYSQKRRDDVFAYFSIPPGIVTAGASSGSSNRSSSSSSVNSMVIFVNDQKQLKNRFLAMAQTMYCSINNSSMVMESIADGAAKRQRKDDSEVRDEVDTDVEMPGIPEDKVLIDLYMLGVLSYEALCDMMAAKHGLSRSRAFNPTPTIDVKLLNGIKPEPPKAGGGK